MPISVPKFITTVWASLGQKFDIPQNADPLTGKAGYSQGFGPVNLTPVEAGGIPPWGQDMNGVLFDLSSAIQYVQEGRAFPFNQSFADAIGGYSKGSVVSSVSDSSVKYESTIDGNQTPPPSAGWRKVEIFVQDATTSSKGIVRISTQSEVDAGASENSVVTPKTLKNAILRPASETNAGTLKLATQGNVDIGGTNNEAVTPVTMRHGFSAIFAAIGYIAFPSWLGGLIIQWGLYNSSASDAMVDVTMPTSFTTAFYAAYACVNHATAIGGDASVSAHAWRKSNSVISIGQSGSSATGTNICWLAIGK